MSRNDFDRYEFKCLVLIEILKNTVKNNNHQLKLIFIDEFLFTEYMHNFRKYDFYDITNLDVPYNFAVSINLNYFFTF